MLILSQDRDSVVITSNRNKLLPEKKKILHDDPSIVSLVQNNSMLFHYQK